MNNIKVEDIKRLIKKGFDLELISLEFDIPIDRITQYKLELEEDRKPKSTETDSAKQTIDSKKRQLTKIEQNETKTGAIEKFKSIKTYSTKEITDSKKRDITRIEQIKVRYKALFFRDEKKQTNIDESQGKLPREEVYSINNVITRIRKIVRELEKVAEDERKVNINATIWKQEKKVMYSKDDVIEVMNTILSELKKIENCKLTIEQAEELYSLLQSKEFDIINSKKGERITKSDTETYLKLKETKKKIIRRLVESIDIAQSQTEEIEELKRLESKITLEMEQSNPTFVRGVRGRITAKITNISNQKAIHQIRTFIPTSIEPIIVELVNGTLDIKEAEEVINAEAKETVKLKPKNKFALTEEQEKRQILIQIRKEIEEEAKKYHIENPEETVMQLQELCGVELEQAIRTVVKNLISIKDFERAKEVCSKFLGADKEYILMLRKEIRNAETSELVLKLINMQGTEEEKIEYFRLIEKGIRQSNIKLGAVSLGKSRDGLRNITLADVWEEPQIERG